MTYTKRYVSDELENILFQEFGVLDHGFIRVVDYMGGDESIVQAARVSYGKGTKKKSEDRGLIRYLMRHHHTTPFEMCEIKLHVKLPIFVARQWIRHRTANVNEYSARYSILDNEFYVPEFAAEQSSTNNQGRGQEIVGDESDRDLSIIRSFSTEAYQKYLELLNVDESGDPIKADRKGLARELARIVLPTNYYTQWYWKIDLHNLFHFLLLRADSHAQLEIRLYAEVLTKIVKLWVPFAYEAFEEYKQRSTYLSGTEIKVIKALLNGERIQKSDFHLSDREWNELSIKFDLKKDENGDD